MPSRPGEELTSITCGPLRALEHVDTGDLEAHDLRRADGDPLELLVELDRLDAAAAVHVGAELVALRDPAHRRDHAVADDERADVAALALLDEALDQHVLPGALQGLDDRLGDLDRRRQDHADALGALEQLDHDRRAADPLDRRDHVGPVLHEGRRPASRSCGATGSGSRAACRGSW